MEKNLFIKVIALIGSFHGTIYSMESQKQSLQEQMVVTLPSAEVITARLNDLGMEHFVEKTKFPTKLGNEKRYPLGVVMAVEFAIADYTKSLPPQMAAVMQVSKHLIFEALLKDEPAALKELAVLGIYKPIGKK